MTSSEHPIEAICFRDVCDLPAGYGGVRHTAIFSIIHDRVRETLR